jgi:acetoacetyl-CoA synthetase
MKESLWRLSQERTNSANFTRFMTLLNQRHHTAFGYYFALYERSVNGIPDFWAAVWDFIDIKASKKYETVVDDLSLFPGITWFPGAELNFAENLLRYTDKETAIVFKAETRPAVRISYQEPSVTVARVANGLKSLDINRSDRVVGYMPNIPETPIAMLAATSLGATWASCESELGMQAVIDRFSQISPKVLFTVDAEKGIPVYNQQGELVCEAPAPPCPCPF